MAKIAFQRKFAGVTKGGSYYLQGCSPDKMGQASVLTSRYHWVDVIDENDTGFSNLSGNVIQGFASLIHDTENLIGIAQDCKMYDIDRSGIGSRQEGEIHSNSQTAGNNNFIFPTIEDNLLYTSQDWLGIGYFGQAKSSSDDTKIVDQEGRNFSNRGIGTSSHNNKVYNITKGEEHTITSISTTDSTNDTLNFSSGSTTNEQDDYFLVFNDKKFDFFSGTSHPQFKGQEDKADFIREMVQLGGTYIVGNGNYLGGLDIDVEASGAWDDNFKQLPYKTQFRCMSENNDSVIIGGVQRGRGKLMLWDGSTDGWNNILDLSQVPIAINSHQGGWVVLMGASLYFTDGLTVEKLAEYPDLNGNESSVGGSYSGMETVRNKVFINANPDSNNFLRDKENLAVFDFDNGWTFTPFEYSSSKVYKGNTIGAIKQLNTSTGAEVFASYDSDDGEAVVKDISGSSAGNEMTASFVVELEEPVDVNGISISLAPKFDEIIAASNDDQKVDVNVAVSDMRDFLWRRSQPTGSNSTKDKIEVSTSSFDNFKGEKGNKVIFLDGDPAGDVTYITSVDDSSADEVWQVSPSLSSAPSDSGTNMSVLSTKRATPKNKTINLENLQQEYHFSVGVEETSRLFVDIHIELNNGNNMPDIYNLGIHG